MSNHPLKAYREGAGLSLDDLAGKAGTSKASLSRIEGRLQKPSLGLIERLIAVSGGKLAADDFLSESHRDEAEGAHA